MMGKGIVIVGSINVDIVVACDRWPQPGETLLGSGNYQTYGGKGANQAVAAARLGGEVHMLGCVGDDAYGPGALKNLKGNGVDITDCETIEGCSTGLAFITVCQSDNTIIVVQGAGLHVTPDYLARHRKVIEHAVVVLVQLEIPMETVEYTVNLCHELGVDCILNPAPYAPIPDQVLERVRYITPNSTEAELLAGEGADASALFDRFGDAAIITRGKHGVEYATPGGSEIIPAVPVDVIDTTGAGDTFNGAFAVALSEGMDLKEALIFSVAASSLSVAGMGAQGGMPMREEVEELL